MTRMRALVVGCGNMGASHARAYAQMPEVEIAGLVARGASKEALAQDLQLNVPLFDDFTNALARTKPDTVCIATHTDTHEPYALAALTVGYHVFVEKPLASSVRSAERVVAAAQRAKRKPIIGYILRHHPAWAVFVKTAPTQGAPLVMRMNLNQQSHGPAWNVHRRILETTSLIVDCGVHYVDVMCQMTQSRPLRVSAIGARLSSELSADQFNYGQLQIAFEDGSVGWYEVGWGPMMSETAGFVKDVIGPFGACSIVSRDVEAPGQSGDVQQHVSVDGLRIYSAEVDAAGEFVRPDKMVIQAEASDHDTQCLREQQFFLRAIQENLDLTAHHTNAVASLAIVLAADRSIKTGRTVNLMRKLGKSVCP